MARQGKQGIDYFSHDVYSSSDRKLKLLMAKHNVVGYGVFFLLLQDLYKEGYSLKLDEDYVLLFVSEHHLTEDLFNLILDDCLKFGLFNVKIYKDFNILTSRRTQENYLEAIKRRKGVFIQSDTWLLGLDNLPKNIQVDDFILEPKDTDTGFSTLSDLQDEKNVDTPIVPPDDNNKPEEPKKTDPPKKPKEKKLKFHENAVPHIPEYLNNEKFLKNFDEWEQMRIKKKCATSERRYKEIFKNLNEFSGNDLNICIKIVNRSSDKGYTDLYKIKDNNHLKNDKKNNKKNIVNVPDDVVDLRGKL